MEDFSRQYKEVTRLLPHRFPFLFVDRILEIIEGPDPKSRQGRVCVALKNVTSTEPHLVGHFPGKPIMPGVLVLEAMAQTGGVACALPSDPPMDILIATISSAKFRRPVIPGDSIKMRTEVVRDRGRMVVIRSTCTVEGELVAEAEFLAQITPSKE